MARVGRIAGALLAETAGAYFLVGNPKRPCDWGAHGFEHPGEVDALARPYVRLATRGAVEIEAPWLEVEVEGEALPRLVSDSLVIPRTGAVSERLWRLVIGQTDDDDLPTGDAVVRARWLGEIPPAIWQVVRDAVLRCT